MKCVSLLSAAMDGESFLIPFYRIEGIRLLYCTASIIARILFHAYSVYRNQEEMFNSVAKYWSMRRL